ncbi:MAG: ABC transporter permease [Acidobacteriota bacterium]
MGKINLFESFRISLSSLFSNKLRTFLTLLGIIIGVLTVIVVVSIIQGLNKYVSTTLFNFGTNDFFVMKMPGIVTDFNKYLEYRKRKDLTFDDVKALRKYCRNCNLVGAFSTTPSEVKHGRQFLKDLSINGVTAVDHLIGRVFELESGRQISSNDEEHSRKVCIIGWEVKEKLFPYTDPLGKIIKLGNHYFLIIGVGKKQGSILGFNQDNYVRIPLTTFQRIFGRWRDLIIEVHTLSQSDMVKAMDEVRMILRAQRKIPPKKEDDFDISTQETFIDFYKKTTSTLYIAMVIISSISLLVGGIGVMNIMLVSVLERTREIGIRISVGARRKDILKQFLIESSFISGIGGILGIILGFSIAKIVSVVSPLPSAIELWSVIAGLLISVSVGLFFGIYPANKASRLDPIEALRREL